MTDLEIQKKIAEYIKQHPNDPTVKAIIDNRRKIAKPLLYIVKEDGK